MKRLFLLPLILLFCAGIASGQISFPKGSMSGPTTVSVLPLIGNSNLLYDVRDANPNCGTGGGTTRVVCRWNGATYDTQAVVGGAGVGTVTSVSASGGTETTTGSAITSTGTIRSVQSIRTAAGDPTGVLDADRGKVLNVTFAGGSEIDIAQAGTAGSFASGWFTDIKCSGAGGCQIIPTVSTINGAAFYNLTNGQTVRVVSDGTNYKTTLTGGSPISGLTTNTVPVATSATALGDSPITSNPSTKNTVVDATGGTGQFTVATDDTSFLVSSEQFFTTVSTESLTIDGTAHTASLVAASAINLDSKGGVTTIGDVGGAANGTTIALDDSAQVVTVANADLNVSGGTVKTNGLTPQVAGAGQVGTVSLPWGAFTFGSGANNSAQLVGTFTRDNIVVVQDIAQTLIGRGASVALTAQSASISVANIQVNGGVAPVGLYRLTYYLWITVAGTSGTISATFGWSDTAAARTASTGNATFGSLAAPLTGSVIIQADGIANLTYLTTVTAPVGSPQYALRITLERLQ